MTLNAQIPKHVYSETVLDHVFLTTHVEQMPIVQLVLIELFAHASQIIRETLMSNVIPTSACKIQTVLPT